MSSKASAPNSQTVVLQNLINHVFLLPKLPEQEYDKRHENLILKYLIEALQRFKNESQDENQDCLSKCIRTITDFQQDHEQGRPPKEADLCAQLKLRRFDSE